MINFSDISTGLKTSLIDNGGGGANPSVTTVSAILPGSPIAGEWRWFLIRLADSPNKHGQAGTVTGKYHQWCCWLGAYRWYEVLNMDRNIGPDQASSLAAGRYRIAHLYLGI